MISEKIYLPLRVTWGETNSSTDGQCSSSQVNVQKDLWLCRRGGAVQQPDHASLDLFGLVHSSGKHIKPVSLETFSTDLRPKCYFFQLSYIRFSRNRCIFSNIDHEPNNSMNELYLEWIVSKQHFLMNFREATLLWQLHAEEMEIRVCTVLRAQNCCPLDCSTEQNLLFLSLQRNSMISTLHECVDPVGLLQARAAIMCTLRQETEAISADLFFTWSTCGARGIPNCLACSNLITSSHVLFSPRWHVLQFKSVPLEGESDWNWVTCAS